jgi:hypothetical protein
MMRLGTDYFDLKECPKAAIVVHNNYIVAGEFARRAM